MSGVKSHPYHILNPSPWPFVASMCAFVMAIAGIWYMRGGPLAGFLVCLGAVTVCAIMWWRDVIKESGNGVDHTEEVAHGLRMGMLLFIASEVMFSLRSSGHILMRRSRRSALSRSPYGRQKVLCR